MSTVTVLTGILVASLMTNVLLFFIDEPVYSPDWVRIILAYLAYFGHAPGFIAMAIVLCVAAGTPLIFHTDHRARQNQVVLFLLALIGMLCTAYFLWATNVLRIWSIPTPAPIYHPGKYLPGLHDWIDRQNPIPPGYLKYHGEVYRLRAMLGAASCTSLLLSMIPISHLARAIKTADPRYCAGCGYDLKGTKEAGRHECPECGRSL